MASINLVTFSINSQPNSGLSSSPSNVEWISKENIDEAGQVVVAKLQREIITTSNEKVFFLGIFFFAVGKKFYFSFGGKLSINKEFSTVEICSIYFRNICKIFFTVCNSFHKALFFGANCRIIFQSFTAVKVKIDTHL